MPSPSPVCTINGGSTPASVAANATVNGALASAAGVNFWSITCTNTDELNTAAAINATLTVNATAKTFSFTSPGTGSAAQFTSTVGVNGPGLDANSVRQAAYTTTFLVNVLTSAGAFVVAVDETVEQSAAFGWAVKFNTAARLAGMGGGGGGGSTLLGSFTMPAIGSTVTPVTVVNGAPFSQGYSVAITVGGLPSYMTVTLVSGNILTLLNNGGPTNVLPTNTVPTTSIITVSSTNGPIGATAPKYGQALVLGTAATYQPRGIQQVHSLWEFTSGVAPTAVTDWGPILQTAFTFMAGNGGILDVPVLAGGYNVATGVVQNFSATTFGGFVFRGAVAATRGSVCYFTWTGAKYGYMFTLQSVVGFLCENIDFYGNTLASSTWWLPSGTWTTTENHWTKCAFLTPLSAPYWIPNHTYATSTVGSPVFVVGPAFGDFGASQGAPSNNGYIYECISGGTSHSGGPGGSWGTSLDTSHTVTDGGAIWQMRGRSGSSFLVGTEVALGGGQQVDQGHWEYCSFGGDSVSSSGWRVLGGNNTECFWLDHCSFSQNGRHIDAAFASAVLDVQSPKMLNSYETDVYVGYGTAQVCVHSPKSEGGAMMLKSDGNQLIVRYTGSGEYNGTLPTFNGVPVAIYLNGTKLGIAGQYLSCNTGATPVAPTIMCTNPEEDGVHYMSVTSQDNLYVFAQQLPIVDTSADFLVRGYSATQQSQIAGATQVQVVSINDTGTLVDGSTPVMFQNLMGTDLALGTLMMPASLNRGETVAGLTYSYGKLGGICFVKVTIPYTCIQFVQSLSTFTFTIHAPFVQTKIVGCYADLQTTFKGTGITGITMAVGKVVPVSGTPTTNAYLQPSDVWTATTGTAPYGSSDAQLGTTLARASAVQGGDMVWGVVNPSNWTSSQWDITTTWVSTGGNFGNGSVTNLSQGSVDVYILYMRASFYLNGQTGPG